MRSLLLLCGAALSCVSAAYADKASAFFDPTGVREIRLTIDDPNWYNTLYQAHANDASDPYFPARFQYGDTVIEKIGVRFKGSSSFRRGGNKKSFKLDFNVYDDAAKFLGLKKLNLNNGDLQPDFLREKLFFDFLNRYIPASRATHVRLYVNDVLQGVFIGVEQPDMTMMESRFGDNEDGNLYEAGEQGATLSYLGTEAAAYQRAYTLKTNEDANDYSGLVRFLDILNNTAASELAARLEPVCDVEEMLYSMALNNLFVNLDSYTGSGSEYMVYQRTADGRFIHLHWDGNESFGITGDGSPSIAEPAKLDPLWLPTASTGGRGGPGGGVPGGSSRPLIEKLWAVPEYKRTYLRMFARMLREGFNSATFEPRIAEVANAIREDVYADPKKLFSNSDFDTAISTNLRSGQTTIPGIAQFVRERYTYLRPVLDAYAQASDLRLNEIAAAGYAGHKDEAGDADPWVEIHNLGPGTLNLGGYYLSDEASNPAKWALPSRSLADGEYLVVWLDGETTEGAAHASFRPQVAGGRLYLYNGKGSLAALIDGAEYPQGTVGMSHIRLGSMGSKWGATNLPTPAAANPAAATSGSVEPVGLVINELMADNTTTIVNPGKAGAYDDWIEIYNPGPAAVNMGGMYLTDDLSNPAKYRIPEGTTISAGGYLVFWADDQTSLGALHTNFKLGAGGEHVGLFHIDGVTRIDAVTFGQQNADVSYGRTPNGGMEWTAFSSPTPGAKN